MPSCAPGASTSKAPRARASARYTMSTASVLLPEPLGPVMAHTTPSGRVTSAPRRLFSRAPRTTISPRARRGAFFRARWPLNARDVAPPERFTSSTLPSAVTRPPSLPAPGPISTTRSAARITAGSCSTTSTALSRSASSDKIWVSGATSAGCSPTVGSSSTNSALCSEVPSAAVSVTRCASPPESVRAWRSSVR